MSEHDDAALIERVRNGLGRLDVPGGSPREAMVRGRRRRRLMVATSVLAIGLLGSAVIVPLSLLSHMGNVVPHPHVRPLPLARCPVSVAAPPGATTCYEAVARAWSAASFIQAADSVEVEQRSYPGSVRAARRQRGS